MQTPSSPEAMKLSGALDRYESIALTPCIGTEFRNVDVAEWIKGPDSEALIRDLGILCAQRGVLFFRGQKNMNGELQKELTQRMGLLSGKPAHHGLAKHPMHIIRKDDPLMSKLDTATQQATHKLDTSAVRQTHAYEWHSDHSHEPCPPDFTMLRMTQVPPVGGDTLWASGYELYDRLSPPYQKFFESLTATHDVAGLRSLCEAQPDQSQVYTGERGAPENHGLKLKFESHPMVRTHPVTRWKTLWAGGLHCRRINGVTESESQEILAKLLRLVADNHDMQVRFRWQGEGDIAVWDNRCVLHCATHDHQDLGAGRMGWRTLSVAEKPFFDPLSLSRKQEKAMLSAGGTYEKRAKEVEEAKVNGHLNEMVSGLGGPDGFENPEEFQRPVEVN